MKLNETQIRYLLAVLHRSVHDDVRSVDVAGVMGDTQPTAHKRLASLAALGLIAKRKYRNIRFTDEGMRLAERLQERYWNIFHFFRDVLDLPQAEAEENTYVFMGSLSEQSLEKLEGYVQLHWSPPVPPPEACPTEPHHSIPSAARWMGQARGACHQAHTTQSEKKTG